MASVNKVILIGNLGRVSRELLDGAGKQAFDNYLDAVQALFGHLTGKVSEMARKLAEASGKLYELAKPFVISQKTAVRRMPRFSRTAAFFHAAKVDARNLP